MGSILLQHSIGCVARRLAAQTETRADSPACDCGVDDAFRYIAELEAERDEALDAEEGALEVLPRWERVADALGVGQHGPFKASELGRSRSEMALARCEEMAALLRRFTDEFTAEHIDSVTCSDLGTATYALLARLEGGE